MKTKGTSTRRSFLKKGALLAVPLAAAAPAVVVADDGLKTRLARLEDEAAIRRVHQSWLRQINTAEDGAFTPAIASSQRGASDYIVRGITPDHAADPDAIEVAAGRENAAGRFHCLVEFETMLAKDSTLAQMAHAQGSGFVRHTERRALHVRYVKDSGAWSIAGAEFA